MQVTYPWCVTRHPGHANQKVHGRKRGVGSVAVQPSLFDAPPVPAGQTGFRPAGTIAQAETYARETLGIEHVFYEGLSLNAANTVNRVLTEYKDGEFTDVVADFNFIGAPTEATMKPLFRQYANDYVEAEAARWGGRETVFDNAWRRAVRCGLVTGDHAMGTFVSKDDAFKGLHGIALHAEKFTRQAEGHYEAKVGDMIKRNGVVGQDDNYIATIVHHEMGHAIARSRGVRYGHGGYRDSPEKDAIENLFYDTRREARKTYTTDENLPLSTYAFSSPDEFVAESWAAYRKDPTHPIGSQVAFYLRGMPNVTR